MSSTNTINTIPKCCAWGAYYGINQTDWSLDEFKKLVVAQEIPQAVIFNGSYGLKADVISYVDSGIGITAKSDILRRCDLIQDFIDVAKLGDTYEIPDFQNKKYGKLHTFIWITDQKALITYREAHGWKAPRGEALASL